MITASIVTYNHCLKDIEPVLKSLVSSPVSHIFVIDHSDSYATLEKELRDFKNAIESEKKKNPNVSSFEYQFSYFNYQYDTEIIYIRHRNNGYGGGHNVALRKVMDMGVKYHLVVNPDVWFDANVIPALISYLDNHDDVGHIMPKVMFPDGGIQCLAKLLPTPVDMFGRFLLLRSYLKRNNKFELHHSGYRMILNVPFLSGCFMLLRTEALEKVGLFDDRFFMYAEDIDLTRRIHEHYKTILYPKVEIYHRFTRGSSKNLRLFFIHITSIIKYFNKWGWISDKKRDQYNNEVLNEIEAQL